MNRGRLKSFRVFPAQHAAPRCWLPALALLAVLATSLMPTSASTQQQCGPEPDMRRAALDSNRPEPSDAYLGCHNGSDHILTVTTHRNRVILTIEFERAKADDTPDGWRDFLGKYPTGDNAREAAAAVKRLMFEEYPASAFDGSELLSGATDRVDMCRSACSYRNECKGFTFAASRQACTLWSSVSRARPDADTHSGSRDAVAVAPAAPTPPAPQATFDEYENTTLSGRVLSSGRVSDIATCRRSCANSSDCRGFSFFSQRGVCTLWDAITFRRAGARTVSGIRTDASQPRSVTEAPAASIAPQSTAYAYEYGIDFNGGDLRDPVRDVDRSFCERLCSGHTSCRAFTYNTDRRACFIKHSVVRRVSFAGAVSGMKR